MIILFDNKVYADICSIQLIANVNEEFRKQYNLNDKQNSLGLVTLTLDDVGYVAIDEATKTTDVSVVYAHSFYAGSDHASGPLSGEFIGIVAGESPAEVKSALDSIRQSVETKFYFEKINNNDHHLMFAQTISSCGSYLAKENNIEIGQALAYLIAPPIEAIVGVDAALKAADVSICQFFSPPTETNFAGAILTGSQSACTAAVEAFKNKVIAIASNPIHY